MVKKIISSMVAIAMMLSMSISAFATDTVVFGGNSKVVNDTPVSTITFEDVYIFDKEMNVKTNAIVKGEAYENLVAGDILMFPMNGVQAVNGEYKVDKDWKIKVTNSRFVENAEFFYDEKNVVPDATGDVSGSYVKITLSDNFNSYEADYATFEFFVYDKNEPEQKTAIQSVKYKFADYAEVELDEFDVNTIVSLEKNTVYTLADGVKSANVMFDMDGLNIVVRMYEDEEYLVKEHSVEYNKELSIKYDTDIEVITIDSNIDIYDILFESKKDDKAIYVVDGDELVLVETEYVEKYELNKGEYTLIKGYVVENVTDAEWVVLDADVEIAVKEPEVEKPVETPSVDVKPNPETGAGNVVSVATAMAVMSVIGLGVLSSKR